MGHIEIQAYVFYAVNIPFGNKHDHPFEQTLKPLIQI